MKDNWMNDLKEKMSDHKEGTPVGLWEDIEKDLFGEERSNIITFYSKKKKYNLINKKYISIAASVILLLGTLFFPYFLENTFENTQNSTFNSIYHNQQESNTKLKNITNNEIKPQVKTQGKDSFIALEKQIKEEIIQQNINNYIADEIEPIRSIEKTNLKIDREIKIPEISKIKKKKFKVSLALNSFQMGNATQQYQGLTTMRGDDLEENGSELFYKIQNYVDQAQLGTTDYSTEIVYKNPIFLGATVNIQLTEKIFINTGISYSKLSSESQFGNKKNNLKTIQDIHYLGLPLNIHYKFYEKSKVNTYVFSGIMTEKAISASEALHITNDGLTTQIDKNRLKPNSIQVSTQVGLGVGYSIHPNFDITIEPTLRYNFKDNSEFISMYQNKPVNFNVRMGLKYTFSK